jgi:cobalt/nickel transport system permease protein
MHMSDTLISPAVGAAMFAVSAAAVAYSAAKVKKDGLCVKKVSVAAAAGALVFAAQMANFAVPGTGASGHIGGGLLLAALLGAFPAMLAMSAVLAIQCLLFADGGLLALGANIFNLGVIPCLIAYPLIFKPLAEKGAASGRIAAASMFAAVAGLQLGAFGVVIQTQLSGVTALPFADFAMAMQPIHFAIGLVEGGVTAVALVLVYKMRPEIMKSATGGTAINSSISVKKVAIAFTAAALVAGGGLSLLASSAPDGLEWSAAKTAGTAELGVRSPLAASAASLQEKAAVMPGYGFKGAPAGQRAGTSAAGVAGSALTFAIVGALALAVSRVKRPRAAV